MLLVWRLLRNCWTLCLQAVLNSTNINIYFLEIAKYKNSHSIFWKMWWTFSRNKCDVKHVYFTQYVSVHSTMLRLLITQSGSSLFKLKVTWNYANSPFKRSVRIFENTHSNHHHNQRCNVRKVNCSCVYSAYILKPVLSGRNL